MKFLLLSAFLTFFTVTSIASATMFENWCNPGDFRCGGAATSSEISETPTEYVWWNPLTWFGGTTTTLTDVEEGSDWRVPCADDDGDGYYEWSLYGHVFCPDGCDESTGQCVGDNQYSYGESFCQPGDQRCSSDGSTIVYCDDTNGDGLYEWSAYNHKDCYPDTCTNGYCTADWNERFQPDESEGCRDICDINEKRCSGPKGYIVCKLGSDGCTYWKSHNDYFCEYGCVLGECRTQPQRSCPFYCTDGDRRCAGEGDYIITCRDYDSDGCYEWGGDWESCLYGCVETGGGEARCLESMEQYWNLAFYSSYGVSDPAECAVSYMTDGDYPENTGCSIWNDDWVSYYGCFDNYPVSLTGTFIFYEYDSGAGSVTFSVDVYDFDTSSWSGYSSYTSVSPDAYYNLTITVPLSENNINGSFCSAIRFKSGSGAQDTFYLNEIQNYTSQQANFTRCRDRCVPGTKLCGGVSGIAEYSFPCRLQANGCYGKGGGEISCPLGCDRVTGMCIQDGELPLYNFCTPGSYGCGGVGNAYSIPCDDDDGNGYYEYSAYNRTRCPQGCDETTGLCVGDISFCALGESRCWSALFPGWLSASDDYVVYCGDTDNDGLYEFDSNNVTYCQWGCSEDYSTTTKAHSASCNVIGDDILAARDAIEYVSGHFDTAFVGFDIRFFIAILFIVISIGAGSYFTHSMSFGGLCGIGMLGITLFYGWIPIIIGAGLFAFSVYIVFKSFVGGESE